MKNFGDDYASRMNAFRSQDMEPHVARRQNAPSRRVRKTSKKSSRMSNTNVRSARQNKGRSNPLPVRRDYPRRAELQRNLTRYYEACTVSPTAKRFSGQRRKQYCAAVGLLSNRLDLEVPARLK